MNRHLFYLVVPIDVAGPASEDIAKWEIEQYIHWSNLPMERLWLEIGGGSVAIRGNQGFDFRATGVSHVIPASEIRDALIDKIAVDLPIPVRLSGQETDDEGTLDGS